MESGIIDEDKIQEILETEGTVYVTGMIPGSPSERAGVKKGDHIFSVNGQRVVSMSEYSKVLKESTGTMDLVLLRNHQVMEITFSLSSHG